MSIKTRIERLEESAKNPELLGEIPDWALKQAIPMFSDYEHPVHKFFREMAEEKGEEYVPDASIPKANPDYIPDSKEREHRIKEYARELFMKYGTEEAFRKRDNPVQDFFNALAKAEPENCSSL
jgi:DNA modification methylase